MPHLYYSWNLYYEFIIPYYYFTSFTQLRDPLQIFICNRCLFSTFLVNFLMTHFWKRVLIPTCCESVKWESFSVDWLQRQWWNGKPRCVRCNFFIFLYIFLLKWDLLCKHFVTQNVLIYIFFYPTSHLKRFERQHGIDFAPCIRTFFYIT